MSAGTPRQLCPAERLGNLVVLTLDRPEARNALDIPLLEAFVAGLAEGSRAGAGVVLVRATGPVFCAGADVRSDDGTATGRPGLRRRLIEQSLDLLGDFPAVVAAVQGAAVGAGWAVAAAADITLAAPAAWFRFPELPLGFPPPDSTVRRLGAAVGPARALRLLALDERFTADDLAGLGLVEVVPAAALDGRARETAARLAALPVALLRDLKTGLSAGKRAPAIDRPPSKGQP
ncbi:enoyl-CoA hydratase/isomerase family protein [Nocardia sp. BMG111209]|uniref:enoyl-CoA hydratase/isomerase family protein n=1 Tax=Nocardia sp. BMG111209 TaxID=1160137 RepID=UPI000369F160|nr:enoyl-CoA hydratase/isomerase family protein [Nocardia sp. BMG111209]